MFILEFHPMGGVPNSMFFQVDDAGGGIYHFMINIPTFTIQLNQKLHGIECAARKCNCC